jgi:hypothetical protein
VCVPFCFGFCLRTSVRISTDPLPPPAPVFRGAVRTLGRHSEGRVCALIDHQLSWAIGSGGGRASRPSGVMARCLQFSLRFTLSSFCSCVRFVECRRALTNFHVEVRASGSIA